MAFMLCFAPTDAAQDFFNDFVSHCAYQKRFRQLYQSLAQAQHIDLNYSEFIGAAAIKLTYVHGLTVGKAA
jgi:histidinol phosphatase-like enzyme